MVKKSEIKKEETVEKKDIFKAWGDSYASVSEMWEDSYINLYKPWIESTGEMLEKAIELSKEATPEKYKQFFDDYMQSQRKNFGKFYPFSAQKSDRESLEKILAGAEETNNIFKSWIAQIEENTQKTRKLLEGEADTEKYREYHNMWIKSYEKIFDGFLSIPFRENTKEVFENYSGIPNIYLRNFVQMSKLWKNMFVDLYWPWIDPMMKLSAKMVEISRGDVTPEAYREFYNLWMNTYQETSGRMLNAQSLRPSKEMFENFQKSANIYLDVYKSWLSALEKMSAKVKDLSGRASDPEAYKEFYGLWVKTYEKAFDDFFENMPVTDPSMKTMMEPVKNAAKIYRDTFVNMASMWIKSGAASTQA